MNRYLMTHSLLSSWLYMMESQYESADRNPMDEFLTVLRREPTPTSEAMQKGIDFENLVTAIVDGETTMPCQVLDVEANTATVLQRPISEHPWYEPAAQIAKIVKGGILQCVAKRDVRICGMDFLLYGRLDALKGGSIYDIKFTSRYDAGKYYDSTQHPMYMFIVPEANEFSYLASNGTNVWIETYRRDETNDIRVTVELFIKWLRDNGLERVYLEHWGAR